MLEVENLLSFGNILLDLALDPPRDRQQPIEIVAHHRRFRRHRRHLLELFELSQRLVLGFFRQLGVFDLFFELGDVVALVRIAKFFLNGLHLLIQIVLALCLLHLTFDTRTNLFLDLQNRDFAFHQCVDALKALGNRGGFKHVLLVGDFHRQVRSDGIGQLRVILDLANGAQNFRRDFLVELHIALELRNDRAGQCFKLIFGAGCIRDALDFGFEIIRVFDIACNFRAGAAFDQHFDSAVGELQQLQYGRKRAYLIDGIGRRIVVAGVLLSGKQDLLVGAHDFFKRRDRFLAPDKQRHDHIREDHDVAQWQNRKLFLRPCFFFGLFFFAHDYLLSRVAESGISAPSPIARSVPIMARLDCPNNGDISTVHTT